MKPVSILLLGLCIYAAIFFVILLKDIFTHRKNLPKGKTTQNILISLFANFFDTLGIGSFAIATTAWKFTKSNSDELIPGTLNVAFTIPTVTEAVIFIRKIEMDIPTLVLMIAAAVIGAAAGARIISRFSITKIRMIMGFSLLFVAAVTLCKINAIGPFGIIGTAKRLDGKLLVCGIIGNLFLGSLMPAGIGLYAPCMALVLFLGMSAEAAFPVMMGSCGFLMPSAGITFIKEGKYHRAAVIPMSLAGVAGVLAANSFIAALPLTLLTYLACAVMIICSATFFHDAWKNRPFRFSKFRRTGRSLIQNSPEEKSL